MDAKITILKDKNYLLLTGPSYVDVEAYKTLRRQLNIILLEEGIAHILHDLRDLDTSSVKLLDADTLAITFKAELPACKRIAIICRQSNVTNHYQAVNYCCQAVDLQMFSDPELAEAWLCNDHCDDVDAFLYIPRYKHWDRLADLPTILQRV